MLWDPGCGAFWWTDIQSCRLYRYILRTDKLDIFPTPERLCAFGLTGENGLFIAAFESGFATFRPESGAVHWLSRIFPDSKNLRFNDGRVDDAGRFWCGTMAEDGKAATIARSRLYCLNEQLEISEHLANIHIANSLCWSPDGRKMYFADSPTQQIQCFDFDQKSGVFSNPGLFATTVGVAVPDGSVTDSAGYLWNAQWGGSEVVRYSPEGTVDFTLELPVSQPTCVAFGGPDLDLLCVTTAQGDLSEAARAKQPHAGNLFIYQIAVSGCPPPLFKGNLS